VQEAPKYDIKLKKINLNDEVKKKNPVFEKKEEMGLLSLLFLRKISPS